MKLTKEQKAKNKWKRLLDCDDRTSYQRQKDKLIEGTTNSYETVEDLKRI